MKTPFLSAITKCMGICLLLSLPDWAFSQADKALLRELSEDNQKSIEALVLYPEDIRLAILEATKYPEVLIKVQHLRDKTSAAFRTLIEDFPREDQTIFYDLTRYPGLIASIAQNRNDTRRVRDALDVLPDNQQDRAYQLLDWNMGVLVKIDHLNQTAASAYETLFASYAGPSQMAFRKLLDLPEVIDILNEDLRFTVLVGDLYRDDPAWVIGHMDSLNLVVARNHAQELEEWKQHLENNPEARTELQSAAAEYSAEYGYDDAYYDYRHVEVHHYYHYDYHYPYWYGYPWWHPYPRWRPYPYWWDWGYNFWSPGVVIVYMPSYHFMHWYFHRPHHHYYYNHLSTIFVNHYYGHRGSGSNIAAGVRDWRMRNKALISDEFLADKNRLPERLKEYGKFEKERADYNAARPGRETPPQEFLDKNSRKYPELERSAKEATMEVEREKEQVIRQRADWAPVKEAPAKTGDMHKPAPDRPQPPAQRPPAQPTEPSKKDPAVRTDTKSPSDARDYHQQKWEEPRRDIQRPAPPPAPKPTGKVVPKSPVREKNIPPPAKSGKTDRNG